MDYKKLYLKYKKKYLLAKNKMKGGSYNLSNKITNNNDFLQSLKDYINSKDVTVDGKSIDPNQNLLLIIFAPWCGHCKNLITNEASELEGNELSGNIRFIDGDDLQENNDEINELKNILEPRGYPTILKISKDSTIDSIKKEEFMGGERTASNLINFLKK